MALFLFVSSLLFCSYLHLTFTNSGATSLAFQCSVPEDCYASDPSQKAWFSMKLCCTMLSYEKETVKTKQHNINVLYLNLLFILCLHFFPWNLYSYLKTLMSLPWRFLHFTSEDYVGSLFYDVFLLSIITVWNEKKIKIMFPVFWLVLEHMECVVVKFNMKINEMSWNILVIISLKVFEPLEHYVPNQKAWSLY